VSAYKNENQKQNHLPLELEGGRKKEMLASIVKNERDDDNYERYSELRIHNRSGKMEHTSLRAKVKSRS